MFDTLRRVLKNEFGLSAIEYSLFATLFAVVGITFLFQTYGH